MNEPKRPRRGSRFSPRTKAAITMKLSEGRTWKGTRRGVVFTFERVRQYTLEGHRTAWTARQPGGPAIGVGTCGTVPDAIDQAEKAVASYMLDQ